MADELSPILAKIDSTVTTFSLVLESALIPAYYSCKGRSYAKYRALLEESQWWAPEEIRQFQWQELRRLLEHVFRSVPYYKIKYKAAGIDVRDIRTVADFSKLPSLTRDEVNLHRAELCSVVETGKLIAHSTGGSSGVPTNFFITMDSYDWRCATSARAYSWTGHRIGERTLYLWGAPIGKVSRFETAKLKAYRLLRREHVVPTFSQTPELWKQTLKSCLRFRPKFIVGYVSSIEEFAGFLLKEGAELRGIKAVISAAEPVHARTRDLVEQAFAAPFFNAYGSREFMSIASECRRQDGLHIHSENLLVETEFPSSDLPSEILITDLHNYGMPFIRYRIGDVGVLSDGVCSCGRGLPLFRSVDGRVLQMLRTRSGRVIPGEFFPHLLKDVLEISEFQVRQVALDEIVISVVLKRPLEDTSQTMVRRETLKVFGDDVQVSITPVQSIPRLPSGKRMVTVGLGA